MASKHIIIRVILLIIIAFCTCSCKNIVKKIGKETIGEVAEESSEVVAKKGGKAVAKTAKFYNGGGHVRAAGFTMRGSFYDIVNNISDSIAIQLGID